MVESKSLDYRTVEFTYLGLSTVDPKSLYFSMQNLKALNLGSIPQTISILCEMKTRLKFSVVESKSLDYSTVGFTYLGLRTVESTSLEFSIEKWDISFFSLIPETISFLDQMKKNLTLVWWSRNHLILVRSGSRTSA